MASVYYIGDEATACGYRLAGAETRVPGPAETAEVFRRAVQAGADLILLSAEVAGELGAAALDDALAGSQPLVAVVPDVLGRHQAPDVAREVRLALGIES